MRNKFLTVCFLVLTIKSIQAQSVVINGDFSGGLTNWTVVQPPDDEILAGSLGQIQFVGETRLSEAFEAQVGYNSQQNLEQTVSLSAGVQYDFYADVAAIYPIYNLDGGTITISIEGNDVASISFGAGITQYGTLEGTYNPTESGNELMAINFDRSYEASFESPIDYIGNISLTPVPEPSPCSLASVALFSLALIRCRGRIQIRTGTFKRQRFEERRI